MKCRENLKLLTFGCPSDYIVFHNYHCKQFSKSECINNCFMSVFYTIASTLSKTDTNKGG